MSATTLHDPRRYFEAVAAERADVAEAPPVCLYLEVTNRCNLLCETCPRTFEDLEPPADMSWELFTRIVDQVPNVARVVLHGVGEPMLVKNLPKMIRYLKDRGTYVLFNTNGTLLNPKKFQEIIDTGLDELRVSLDAADRASYAAIRGKDFFPRIVRDVGKFTAYQRQMGVAKPARIAVADRAEGDGGPAAGIRAPVGPDGRAGGASAAPGLRRDRLRQGAAGIFAVRVDARRGAGGDRGGDRRSAPNLGVTLDASGATEPGLSLKRAADDKPWATCRRPWSLMYFTAHGRALPCCIAPFSARGYENYTLGDATQQTLAGNLEQPGVSGVPRLAAGRHAAGAVPELRAAMELVGRPARGFAVMTAASASSSRPSTKPRRSPR